MATNLDEVPRTLFGFHDSVKECPHSTPVDKASSGSGTEHLGDGRVAVILSQTSPALTSHSHHFTR